MKEAKNTAQSQRIKDENSTKQELSKIDKNKRKKSAKKPKKELRDVKVINLSNIKHGQLDRMINESEKLNSALKHIEKQGSI
tara:strand:+ start:457 stop:702 length:246 start_codon:yes stop_codon:yes gene_type:complete